MTAAAIRRQSGTYVIGAGAIEQRTNKRTIPCDRGETADQFLERLPGAIAWPTGTELEFVVADHRLGCVRAQLPVGVEQAELVIGEPLRSVLQTMLEHGFGSVTFIHVGNTLLHKVSSFTMVGDADADLERLGRDGDQVVVEGHVTRLIRWALPRSLWPLVGLSV